MAKKIDFRGAVVELVDAIGQHARTLEIKYATLDGEAREPEPGEHIDWTVTAVAHDGREVVATREGVGGDRRAMLLAVAAVARDLGVTVKMDFEYPSESEAHNG